MQQRQTTSVGGAPVQGLNCFRRWAVSPSNSLNHWRNLSCVSGLEGLSALGAPHKAGCPSSAPPPSPSPSSKHKTWKHLSKHCRPHSCFHFQGPTLSPIGLDGVHVRLPSLSKGSRVLWTDNSRILVMTMLENPHLEIANCICICTPRNGQDRGRPLSNHPRIGLPAAANKAAWKNGQAPPARRPRTPSRLTINVQTAIRNTGNARLTLSPAHHTAVPTSSPHLQHSGRCVWPCFAHRPRPSTHHRHHRPTAVRGGPPAPPETNARVSRVPTALPATPPERTFSLFIFAPFCADGLHHAAKFAPGS